MIAQAFTKPISVMMEAGAFPTLLIARQESGNLIVMPMVAMEKGEITALLGEAKDALENGTEVETTRKPDESCRCAKCAARRADAEALDIVVGKANEARAASAESRVVKPILSPTKREVH